MNRIEPNQLWMGHAGDTRLFSEILGKGIRAVVQLAAEESPVVFPRDLISLRFPLFDGTGNDADLLDLAVHSVANLIERGIPTLVCCGAGMSRSPAIVAAAFSIVGECGLDESLKAVSDSHPADVSPGFWDDVRRRATSSVVEEARAASRLREAREKRSP